MAINQSQISCGVFEMFNLNSNDYRRPMSNENYLINSYYECLEENDAGQPAFITFSDVSDNNGERLAKFIEANDLGAVDKTRIKQNPNTGRRIRVYVWDVNWKAYTAWVKKNDPLWDSRQPQEF